jgi:hypothetical protein
MKQSFIGVALTLLVMSGSASTIGGQATTECAPSGGLSFICGIQNPEDLVLVPNTQWLIASGMAPGSGLHLIDTKAKTARNLYRPDAASARRDRKRFPNCQIR